jgi:predicted Zn-dependent protease
LAQLTPADRALIRSAAGSELAARHFDAAIGYIERALALDPGDPALLNLLGYSYAYAGKFDDAVRALRDYERARPQDANPPDSLAEVHFYYGRFAEAAEFWRKAYDKDPAFFQGAPLLKSAVARLFAGDTAAADSTFARYEALQRTAGDANLELQRARWDWLRGRRSEAIRRVAAAPGPAASCVLTVWLLETGDRAGAAKPAACRFLLDPRSAPNPMTRAYALLLGSDFQAAASLLRDVVARAAPSPSDPSPVMLAWALVETGAASEAAKFLRYNPVPTGTDPFETLVYPRIFELREKVSGRK